VDKVATLKVRRLCTIPKLRGIRAMVRVERKLRYTVFPAGTTEFYSMRIVCTSTDGTREEFHEANARLQEAIRGPVAHMSEKTKMALGRDTAGDERGRCHAPSGIPHFGADPTHRRGVGQLMPAGRPVPLETPSRLGLEMVRAAYRAGRIGRYEQARRRSSSAIATVTSPAFARRKSPLPSARTQSSERCSGDSKDAANARAKDRVRVSRVSSVPRFSIPFV